MLPQRFRAKPRWYDIAITIGQGIGALLAGAVGKASVTIQDVPFLLKRITWAMTSLNGWAPLPFGLIPDGFFQIQIKTDNHTYMLDPISINAAFGTGFGFFWMDLPSPVELRPKTTVTFELTTLIPRTAPVSLQFVLHGAEPDPAAANLPPVAP
jgi:hypothetical protein